LIRVGEGDGHLRPPERCWGRWFNVHDFSSSSFLGPSAGYSAEEDVHRLVGFLEVVAVGFLLTLLVVRVPWLWSILECSPELVALLGGVVVVQMPRALFLQQVFEAAGGLF
jgi:hypothetical protein